MALLVSFSGAFHGAKTQSILARKVHLNSLSSYHSSGNPCLSKYRAQTEAHQTALKLSLDEPLIRSTPSRLRVAFYLYLALTLVLRSCRVLYESLVIDGELFKTYIDVDAISEGAERWVRKARRLFLGPLKFFFWEFK